MDEDGWNRCTAPEQMVAFLRTRGHLSDRKLRLFAAGCCRRIWEVLGDDRSRKAVEVAEQYADGLASREQLVRARDQARGARRRLATPLRPHDWRAATAAQDAVRDTASSAANNVMAEVARVCNRKNYNAESPAERELQAALLRCLFGNPFRAKPDVPDACLAWNGGTVKRLAESVYERRAWEELPVLADALEESGCHDADILGHCRGPGPHARECWVLDLLSGRERGMP